MVIGREVAQPVELNMRRMIAMRWFVQQSPEDRRSGVYLPTCSILDREALVRDDDGCFRYFKVIGGLRYLEAWNICKHLNESCDPASRIG